MFLHRIVLVSVSFAQAVKPAANKAHGCAVKYSG